jgi:hypothetical protein
MATMKDILGREPTKKERDALCDSLERIARPTRWKRLNLDELLGADYALRMIRTSPLLRGETLKLSEELINEVRMEINSRPDDCMRRTQPGFSFRVINCEDCPFKEYGLRKCGMVDKWFDDFEIETGIVPWCPKVEER